MRRSIIPIMALALLFVGALGVGMHAAAQGATPVGTPTGAPLTFEVQFHDTLIVADQAKGFQPGDRVILSDTLLQNGAEVGHNGGVCTITDAEGGEMFCAVTWSLPDGTISTQFLNTPPPEKTFAVVGGTGAYQGASGTGTLVEHGDETGTVSFDLGGA